jgi:NitT/TauT family transport system substrate-binding protein
MASSTVKIAVGIIIGIVVGAAVMYYFAYNVGYQEGYNIGVGEKEVKQRVIFTLDWAFVGSQTPFFTALGMGFYDEVGLDVVIQRGFGSSDTVRRVAVGESDFGLATMADVAIGRTAGEEVKMIGMIDQSPPQTLYVLSDSGINEPKDFEGKKFGGEAWSDARKFFPAFADLAGIDADSVEWVSIPTGTLTVALMAEQIDVRVGWITGTPGIQIAAEEAGKQIKWFLYADYGFSFYNRGFVTSDKMIEENPDLVEKFMEASFKGIQYAIEHPEEAVEIYREYHPEVSERESSETLDIIFGILMDPAIEAGKEGKELGVMGVERVQDTIDFTSEFITAIEGISASDVFTNEFLE